MHFPLVSIGIPVYNGERFLKAAIESALGQTYPSKEIIVVDNGSIDQTAQIIKSYSQDIKAFFIDQRNVSKARNTILYESQGEWIQYLDADDFLDKEKIFNHFKEDQQCHEKIDVYFGSIIEEQWNESQDIAYIAPKDISFPDVFVRWYKRKNPNVGCCLFRKDFLIELGGWNENLLYGSEDNELYMRIFQHGFNCRSTPSAKIYYRANWSSTTFSKRHPLEVMRTEISLFDTMTNWLHQQKILNEERKNAACEAYYKVLKIIALKRPFEAINHYERINKEGLLPLAHWVKQNEKKFPYNLLGFSGSSILRSKLSRLREIEKFIRKKIVSRP